MTRVHISTQNVNIHYTEDLPRPSTTGHACAMDIPDDLLRRHREARRLFLIVDAEMREHVRGQPFHCTCGTDHKEALYQP